MGPQALKRTARLQQRQSSSVRAVVSPLAGVGGSSSGQVSRYKTFKRATDTFREKDDRRSKLIK
eukprot:12916681-Alexandrium_andersonii.AAC.1